MRNYDDKEYAKARRIVLKRDSHKCQMPACGTKRKLQVHHIMRWADIPSLRYDTSNMITLCKTCHKQITGNENLYSSLFIKIVYENSKRH